jgi:hypothetical protein
MADTREDGPTVMGSINEDLADGFRRGRATKCRYEEGIRETGQDRRLVDGFRQFSLNFRWSKSNSCIDFMMDSYADGTVWMVGAIIMVMERLPQKGKEQETDEDE